ncbi:helix-turn-helix domain-containing protein [Thermomonospora amylolytica]|uniref:helix-turn-helix domain-containing protein n=1 Tax=Thermomonospora amylolytica TaxID=1411117 RepID=UPI000E6C3328|nr:helix-turn-helix domain-containing protein [Thermomonospora amylolytica]
MYDTATRRAVLRLVHDGLTASEISRRTGVSRATVKEWRDDPAKALRSGTRATCPRCDALPSLPEPHADYAYLLGLYLGDGCISPAGDPAKAVWALRIMCANAWPGLINECEQAMRAIRPGNKVNRVACSGCTEVKSTSRHWPCLLPQHGPGEKHLRTIRLMSWQEEIVNECTERFVRGLLHSDGCRITNRVRRPLPSGERWYEYPRYLFVNESRDIFELFGAALDRLGVAWRYSKPNTISIAKRDAVARLDEFVGPKY